MLPKIPYKMRKNKSQVVAMGGVNFSGVTRDGDIADSKGISARAYPYLTTRRARRRLTYEAVTAMTVFQGKLVTVKGTELYWSGELIGTVSGGEKQFAAVNTKLVIMPDKVYLDATDGTIKPMGAISVGGGGSFTKTSVTLNNDSVVAIEGIGGEVKSNKLTVVPKKTIWNGSAVINVSDGELRIVPVVSSYITVEGTNVAHAPYRDIHPDEFAGGVHISGRWERASIEYDETRGGLIVVFASHIFSASENGATRWVEFEHINPIGWGDVVDVSFGDISLTEVTVSNVYDNVAYIPYTYNGTISKLTSGTVKRKDWESLTIAFSVGDAIAIYDLIKKEYVKTTVSAITDTTLTFGGTVSDFITYGLLSLYRNIAGETPNLAENFKAGDVVKVKGGTNDLSFKISEVSGNVLHAESEIFTAETVDGLITVERSIPKLDYICESNNRLWGCSNADRTIYASALGDPTNLYTYQGVSTDAWAVGVGSEEDFTGCVAYGGGVLFFKEMKLHKVLGSYPSEYYMYNYDIEGVQKGCHKSLAVMNEVLYYKGIHGVCAYTGGTPKMLSSNFGEREFEGAVAGVDGDTYYIAMRDKTGKNCLFAYETLTGLWVLEDDIRVIDFARIGGDLYALVQSGEVWVYGAGETEEGCEWFVQFTPLYETVDGSKSYSRIKLRLDLPKDSYVIIDVKTDNGIWREAGKVVGQRQGVVPVVIPINRCDKFEIRIRGKNKCTILSMLREYYVGGDL